MLVKTEMTLCTALAQLLAHLSPRRRWQLGALIALMFVGAVAEMATLGAVVPFLAILADPGMVEKQPFLKIVLGIFGGQDGSLFGAALLFSFVAVAAAGVRMLLMWSSLRYSFGLGADIGGEVYRRTLYQPYKWHVSRNSSESLACIDKVNHVIFNILTPLVQGIVGAVVATGILFMLLWIDFKTAIIAGTGFSFLYGVTTLILRRQLVRNSRIISSSVTQRIQSVQEGLGGIRDVLLDGSQPVFYRRFARFDYAMRRAQASSNLIGAAPRYIIESAGMILIVVLAYWLSSRGSGLSSAIPILGALAVGAQKLLPQMQLVYTGWSSVRGNASQLADVLLLLEQPVPAEYLQTDSDFDRARSIVRVDGLPVIALRDVSFRYQPDAPDVLLRINLAIPSGARVGIVGKTGSGKSTFIDLVMGLLEPTNGVIEVDGQPLSSENRRHWQNRIAHVPQAIYLSDASIAENIAFGLNAVDIDLSRVKEAARKAQLSEFIEGLPHQYRTSVGERGVRLSGGQRQRIGLARALYKQADILVLDEATSALDDATERSVMATIEALGGDVTVLMIAHRLSTLSDCDFIVKLGENRELSVKTFESII